MLPVPLPESSEFHTHNMMDFSTLFRLDNMIAVVTGGATGLVASNCHLTY